MRVRSFAVISIATAAVACIMAAQPSLAASLDKTGAEQDAMQRYIVTGQSITSPSLYKNPTPGAIHEMQASDGYYYSFESNNEGGPWPIYKSRDLVNWQRLPHSAEPIGTWGKSRFWVPEVMVYNGKFYMYYCAREIPNQFTNQIGLAISDKIEGPYYDLGHPLFDGTTYEGLYAIDQNPFIDPDTGEKYLFFVHDGEYLIPGMKFPVQSSRVWGVRLSDDMKSIVGEPKELVIPSQTWEYRSYTHDGKPGLWLEAPQILKANGKYYMMYSANFFETASYSLGYAVADHPLGPYTKPEIGPVTSSAGDIQKTGHNTVRNSPDGSEYFTAYTTLGTGRFTSRIGFREDGSMYVNGPIRGYQVMPNGTHGYVNHAQQAKVTASSTLDGRQTGAVTDGEIGIYERFEQYEWVSNGERASAWIRLAWDEPRSVEFIMLHDSALAQRMIKSGRVILNDDSSQTIKGIAFPAGAGEAAILQFPEKKEISSITFVVDELQETNGVAGMSEIAVLGPPTGHVWLSSPKDLSTIKGAVPVEIKGLRGAIAKANVTLVPVTDGIKAPSALMYTGGVLPDHLIFDSLQVEDGTYDLEYSVSTVDGKDITVKSRVIISNWTTVEDAMQPTTTGGWFGTVKHMLTVAETAGWEFAGSSDDILFGDADRMRQKAGTEESLTWELERLTSFEITLYSRSAEVAQAMQVAVSSDDRTWTPVAFSTSVFGQAAGWQKVLLTGTMSPKSDPKLLRITFNEYAKDIELQLGHVLLRGLQ